MPRSNFNCPAFSIRVFLQEKGGIPRWGFQYPSYAQRSYLRDFNNTVFPPITFALDFCISGEEILWERVICKNLLNDSNLGESFLFIDIGNEKDGIYIRDRFFSPFVYRINTKYKRVEGGKRHRFNIGITPRVIYVVCGRSVRQSHHKLWERIHERASGWRATLLNPTGTIRQKDQREFHIISRYAGLGWLALLFAVRPFYTFWLRP